MNASQIKAAARDAGADLVGIAPLERWKDWKSTANPLSIMPSCRSVIVVGRRILRGTLRGVEEGTNFGSTYVMFGMQWQEQTFLSRVIHQAAATIEQAGHEAIPMLGGTPPGEPRPIASTGTTTNVRLDSKRLAHAAGLGIVGKGGFFLTAQYGHRQRFGMILTDLEAVGDPIQELDFCTDCDACLQACPLQALRDTGAEHFELDEQRCASCANGRFPGGSLSCEGNDRFAAACGRACMVALEHKIEERFKTPFRKRSVWTRDLEGKVTLTPLNPKGAQVS